MTPYRKKAGRIDNAFIRLRHAILCGNFPENGFAR